MTYLQNPLRGVGLSSTDGLAQGEVSVDPVPVETLLAYCPVAAPTPLVSARELAQALGIASLHVKDERGRIGLGSFKALGAAYAIAKRAHEAIGDDITDPGKAATALAGQTFVTASAGNHGLSVAAGARIFGAKAVIYLAKTVPAGFADRLRGYGGDAVVEGSDYAASMVAAAKAANDNNWQLLSDSTWEGYSVGRDVMEGYLAMVAEAVREIDQPPTHLFLQAGVGGLAAAVAAYARTVWGNVPQICVVEPDEAPALIESIRAGRPVFADGGNSIMGRLDCKEPSHIALKGLARDADGFLTLSDDYVLEKIALLDPSGLATSSSGGAGFAGLIAAQQQGLLEIGPDARVLLFLSEGPQDD